MDAQQEKEAILEIFRETHRRLLSHYRTCIDNLFEANSQQAIANSDKDQVDIIDQMIFKYTPKEGSIYILCKTPQNYMANERLFGELKRAIDRNARIFFTYTQSADEEKLKSLSNVSFEKTEPICLQNQEELEFITNGKAIRITRGNIPESDAIPNAPRVAKGLINLLEERKYSRSEISALPKTGYNR